MTSVGSAQISAADYAQAVAVGKAYGVDPKLLIAIGIHETGWGSAGVGRLPSAGGDGAVLSYGAVDSNPNASVQFSGLPLQLVGAARLLASNGVTDIPTLLKYQSVTGKNPYGATDTGWTTSVVSTYASIQNDSFTGSASTAYQGSYPFAGGEKLSGLPAVLAFVKGGDNASSLKSSNIPGADAVANVATSAVQDTVGTAAAGISVANTAISTAEFTAKILAELSKESFWIRVGYGAAGIVIVGIGAHLAFGLSLPPVKDLAVAAVA